MTNFQLTVGRQATDLDITLTSNPAYTLLDIRLGPTSTGPQNSQQHPSRAITQHGQSGHEVVSGSMVSKPSSEREYEIAGSRASVYPSSQVPSSASNRTPGIAGFLEAPPSQLSCLSSRSYGSDTSTIRGAPSVPSHVSSRHTEIASPSHVSHASSRRTEVYVPSNKSLASSRHTEIASPSHVSHASSRRTEVYTPSKNSHAFSRHTETGPPSYVSSRNTEVNTPARSTTSHVSKTSSRHSKVGSPSHVSGQSGAGGSIRRSNTSSLSGYDTVRPEDSISSVSSKGGKSSTSRR